MSCHLVILVLQNRNHLLDSAKKRYFYFVFLCEALSNERSVAPVVGDHCFYAHFLKVVKDGLSPFLKGLL